MILSFVERPQQAITVQVQFPAIWLDEGDEFRRIAGYDVCLRAFRCHNSSSISPDHANAQGNGYSTVGTDCPKHPRIDRIVLAFATVSSLYIQSLQSAQNIVGQTAQF